MGKTIDSADSGVEKDDEDHPLKFLGGDVWELNVKDWELDLYIKLTKEEINSLKNIIKSPEQSPGRECPHPKSRATRSASMASYWRG